MSPIARLSPSLLPSPLGLDEVTVNVAGAQTELPPPPPFGQVVASSVIIPDADEITASREREIPEMAPPISSRPPSVHAHDNLTVPGPSSTSQRDIDRDTEDRGRLTPPGPKEPPSDW